MKYHERNLTIDDEEFFENLEKLIEHYKKDADGLCTRLVKPVQKGNNVVAASHGDDLYIINEHELEVGLLLLVFFWVVFLCVCFFLKIYEPIGKGEFCEVMLGKWKKNKVAVKVLKDSSEAEAILMKYAGIFQCVFVFN